VHKNGQKAVALQAKMVRTPLYPVEHDDVERAIRWLDEHWDGAVYVPGRAPRRGGRRVRPGSRRTRCSPG
jgi:hypothetical protein